MTATGRIPWQAVSDYIERAPGPWFIRTFTLQRLRIRRFQMSEVIFLAFILY